MHTTPKHSHLFTATLLAAIAFAAAPCLAQVRMRAEAFVGEPFGVGRLTVEIAGGELPLPLGAEGLGIGETNGRILYPATFNPAVVPLVKDTLKSVPWIRGGPIGQEVGGLLQGLLSLPPRTDVYFLFQGKDPLELTLQARTAHRLTVRPREAPGFHRTLLERWWRNYTASPGLLQTKPDYPPLIESFLATTLARRLNLELPEKSQTEPSQDQLTKEVGVILGTEAVRVAMQQDRILGLNQLDQKADQPPPVSISPPPLKLPQISAGVKVEPIAMRVPAECLYIRFGNFNNFLWFQDTMDRWGGDAQNLIASRGLDLEMKRRIEEQLVVKQSALSRLLGPTVVADVAIIGTDLHFREGAAFGILFHAHSTNALALDFATRRLERLNAGGVTEQKFSCEGKQVSSLASPDGKVRSYYAFDGPYHFVTSSKTLVRRFLETASGEGSLGSSAEFRHARSVMPTTADYSAFVYLSDAFFRNMAGSQYRIETARRLQAVADVDLVQLAALAAATEGLPGGSVERLSGSGLLPRNFSPRPDGSGTVLDGGQVYDSLRGHRGTFVPIPDVPVDRVTPAEVAAYAKFAEFYAENFGRLDPAMIGVRRKTLDGGRERVIVDVRMSAMGGKLHQFLAGWAGPADQVRLAPVPGDLASGEMVMHDQRVFAGLRDFGPPTDLIGDRLALLGRFRDLLVGYIGSNGQFPWIGWFENLALIPPAAAQPAESPGGLFSRQWNQFKVYSLHEEVFATVLPRLKFEKAQRPAQLRLHVGDVSRARMTPFLNEWGYSRTRQTSLGNLRLMHALNQQLHVPKEDCRTAAEFLLAAKLICPLGGRYVFHKQSGGDGDWISTALVDPEGRVLLGTEPPAGYQAPPLNWFRGLEFDAMLSAGALTAHAEVDMQSPPRK